jgi:hypothetical protein
MPRRSRAPLRAHDIAAEIIRRVTEANAKTGGGYVIRLSDPPAPGERLQLLAARLQGTPFAIMPHKCATVEDWLGRHREL